MPMSLKRSLWFGLRWCTSAALLVASWVVWLVLIAGLGLQVWVVTRRELELPDFALRAIERRLAASEITARFGRAIFDPTGRVLFEQVQLFGPDRTVPLVTIRAAYASLDFLPLLVGEVRVHEIRLTGVDLRVPAMLSPSGTDEAVVSDLDGVFQAQRSDYHIAVCTFRVAGVAVTSHGRFHLPPGIQSRPGSMQLLDLVIERCLRSGRKLIALRPQIESLEDPRLQLTLTPTPNSGALVEAELLVDSSHPEASCTVQSGRARMVFPLLGDTPVATEVMIDAERVDWKQQAQVARLHAVLSGLLIPDRFVFTPLLARLTAAGGSVLGLSFAAPAAELTVAEWPRVQGNVMLQAGGSPLTARADVDTRRGDGRIDLSASLGPELLRLAAARFGLKAAKWVTLSEPASLRAWIDLAGGWKLARTEGDISVRHAIAHDVAIDAAGGHIVYDGHGLNVTDLTLFQGGNAAYGSYAMDTATNEYRFLLHGHLRPLDISAGSPGGGRVSGAALTSQRRRRLRTLMSPVDGGRRRNPPSSARPMRPSRAFAGCHSTGCGQPSSSDLTTLRCPNSRPNAQAIPAKARSPSPSIPRIRRTARWSSKPCPTSIWPSAPGCMVRPAPRWLLRSSLPTLPPCAWPVILTALAHPADPACRCILRWRQTAA